MFQTLYDHPKATTLLTILSGFSSWLINQLTDPGNVDLISVLGVWAGSITAIIGMMVVIARQTIKFYRFIKLSFRKG